MNKNIYKIGDEIFHDNSNKLIGTVVGIRETHWSGDDYNDIVYVISTPRGSLRNINEKDIKTKNL